jgi:pimeloyl-ACP methyl ester carboxylesterase
MEARVNQEREPPSMRFVRSADGTLLNVRTDGDPRNPALVFIHGFAQSAAAWQRQADALGDEFFIVRFDLRGHGDSGKPTDDAAYTESVRWAQDVAAVLDALGLRDALLIGWSYGGCVIADYLARYGAAAIAGIVLVGAISLLGVSPAERFANPAVRGSWRELLSPDDATARAGFARFSRLFFAGEVADETIAALVETSLRLPASARAAMLKRTLDATPVWAAYRKPALIVHGDADAVVLPAAGDWHAAQLPHALVQRYPATGHLAFVEAEAAFNQDLRAFASTVLGTVSR